MYEDLSNKVDALMPSLLDDLAALVRIPSVSASGLDAMPVWTSAEYTADLFAAAGLQNVRLLEIPGGPPRRLW